MRIAGQISHGVLSKGAPWCRAFVVAGVVVLGGVGVYASDSSSKFSQTNSRGGYVHWIELYDADENLIDPAKPDAPPYSPAKTCAKCHDYATMAHGYHFNAGTAEAPAAGRPGEPWIWLDRKTGSQIPMSYRGWPGTYQPKSLGISRWDFVMKFGHHLPGGIDAETSDAPTSEPKSEGAKDDQPAEKAEAVKGAVSPRWKLAGNLPVDCMLCHSASHAYRPEIWAEQVQSENFAWAATAAMNLAKIDGSVRQLKDDFDPEAPPSDDARAPRLPQTVYDKSKFNAEGLVFFDVVRKPAVRSCYYCHSVRPVGEKAGPSWTHDGDVHLTAGLTCADCHRNGVGHHTVRGYEGEQHPTGLSVATLSCRGCHLDEHGPGSEESIGGRFGAPKPRHAGLPTLHLEKLSCTACHSGPKPGATTQPVQTSLAHELGLRAHRNADEPPGIVEPVLMRDAQGVIAPHRAVWPAFWGLLKGDSVTVIKPEEAYDKLRKTLRVRRDFSSEIVKVRLSSKDKAKVLGEERAKVSSSKLTEEEKAKLAELEKTMGQEAFRERLTDALKVLAEDSSDATPVYLTGGKAYRLNQAGELESFEHPAAKPYTWPLAHDVRPARHSLGGGGCFDCHADGSPTFYGTVTALGPAPDDSPPTTVMHQLQGLDPNLLALWNQSFNFRTAFKWFGSICIGIVTLVVLLFLFVGLNGAFKLVRRR